MKGYRLKLLWLTDIHLNFLDEEARFSFYQDIKKMNANALLISGDIAEANSIAIILREISKEINKPIYFVLGNHDYYRGRIDEVHLQISEVMQREPLVHWLSVCGVVNINTDAVLIGQDGWADGRLGNYATSQVVLNDSLLIADLLESPKFQAKFRMLESRFWDWELESG
jgi:predicted MPP superfamily phosphohydrolase